MSPCRGSIISDFIPPPKSRRVTSEFIWPDPKNSKKKSKKRSSFFDLDKKFEADFKGFKDDDYSSFDCEDETFADVKKPFLFTAPTKLVASRPTTFATIELLMVLSLQVNASSQFCGVAEMIGPVDFEKSVDYWQQDKWNGQFPVKWHIIKDVPNSQFRHIILENIDNKPVTITRDTQEVKLEQGIEMLKIFKNYDAETSILDDFGFYKNGRQEGSQACHLQEE
ncbi:YTH domain protein [Raphanus sativus]|nr:YTH domain protein [Raphanus sativus]